MQNAIASITILRWLKLSAAAFEKHEDELTQLDAAIGDADHGANMARGFSAVEAKLASLQDQDIGTIFKTTAMTLISTVGGASGPLYGTFFLQASSLTMGKMTLSQPELFAAFDAGLNGLVNRGKAALGDKTMVDVLIPAVGALKPREGVDLEDALDCTAAMAKKAADTTIPMVARKGRASYLGERSAGHLDPGARSATLLLEALWQAVRTKS